MLTCRAHYPADIDFCRRSDRREHAPFALTSHYREPYDMSDGFSNRTSPSSDPDSKSGGPPRKRVPVACNRCRKRKIKCSGDMGDGQGCSNCKNAGSRETCHFLRVQSQMFDIEPQPVRHWPTSHRWSPYGPSPTQRLNHYSIPQDHHVSSTYRHYQPGFQMNAYPSAIPAQGWVREQPEIGFGFNYDEQSHVQMSSQYPPYLQPNVETSLSSVNPYYTSPVSPRSWGSAPQTSKATQNGLYTDYDTSISSAPLGIQYLAPMQVSMGDDSTSSRLHSGINGIATMDRMLPNPTPSRTLPASRTNSYDAGPLSLVQRNSLSGHIEEMSASSQSSGRTLSIGFSDGSESNGTSSASSAPTGHNLGFIPMSTCNQEAPIYSSTIATTAETMQPPLPFPGLSPTTNEHGSEQRLSQSHLGTYRTTSLGSAYTYGNESNIRHTPLENESYVGRLSNGQRYTRPEVAYGGPQGTPYHASPKQTYRQQSRSEHRASLPDSETTSNL